MSDELVLTDDPRPGVRLLTLHRPAARNAFDSALYRATAAALDEARADDAVKVAVLTGAGPAFSAGQDLDEMARIAAGEPIESGFPVLLEALQAFDKPLVAAVNGPAVGIGFTMLPHCDLVLAAESARFRTPFAEMGVPPEAASSYLFPATMGWQRAAEVLFTSPWLSAEEAVACGVARRVVPDGELVAEALALAERVAAAPLPALRAIKSTMLAARADAVAAARRREERAFAEVLGLG
ncbi:MAG: enoyl-CoA hydratase/isomerase family protein [Thermoanaerobacterales bacterium]|jgi:enoyl-CoA hydratase/carnithine racemase|nr:enoyl-CoA hydratase/isomerase family protein [Thermoanaerobacterales bacterium]